METGRRKNKETGELIPAKYIQELSCEHEGKVVFLAQLGTSVSKDPYFAFSFNAGEKGQKVQLRWNDNTGEIKKVEAVIK
jgi:sulfur-oxidizing protein SoxZ